MKKVFWIILGVFIFQVASAQRTKRVVLQGFWWDYKNNNFRNKWADYLTELTPRLRDIGIDAIWIPPAYKCNSPSSVGYNPFDHYDLGDKYQKGGGDSMTVRTSMGNKNELLRMVAVMHTNGMEVIEDIVLNHVNEAGTNYGAGGQDPQSPYSMANASGYKNFRYVSYATPSVNESLSDYWTRAGRWSKNYTNFYPNAANNCTTGDICSPFFGPDVSYEGQSFGQSSNIPTTGAVTVGLTPRNYFNPQQYPDYMRTEARNWMMWMKKQTGFDGWRFDAVKHYPIYVQEDLIYNTKYSLPDFAKGNNEMFCLGEWIGSKGDLDNYMNAVRSGNELHTGTFDFGLRGYCPSGGLYSMVLSQGGYNMQSIPGEQQSLRYYDYATKRVHRTVPFVNNHDNFRPILDASGRYSRALGNAAGWNTGQELGGNGQHIDPREPRLFAAYAVIFALDGNPGVFFEDLFDIGTTGKRFTHLPTNTTDLPVRPDLVNIIQAHQALNYRNGNYAVPTSLTGTQAPIYAKGTRENHLVIERTNQAIISITDKFSTSSNNTQDEEVWVSVSGDWRNLDLIDFSGAHGLTTTRVYADGRVLIKTAPVGHTISGARGHGYSIWAPRPAGVTLNTIADLYAYLASRAKPERKTETTQEWEMSDDLGDSHVKSLKQGGRLPEKSTNERLAGSIYVQGGKSISIQVYPEVNGYSQTLNLYNSNNILLTSRTAQTTNIAPLTLNYTPTSDGWISIKVRNADLQSIGQRVWVNTTYTAPAVVNTRTAPILYTKNGSGNEIETTEILKEEENILIYPNPTSDGAVQISIPKYKSGEILQFKLISTQGLKIAEIRGDRLSIEREIQSVLNMQPSGLYVAIIQHNSKMYRQKLVLSKRP
jgi:alpha-amylase